MAKLLINMVGLPRFELGTSCTPSKRDTRLRYSPTLKNNVLILAQGVWRTFRDSRASRLAGSPEALALPRRYQHHINLLGAVGKPFENVSEGVRTPATVAALSPLGYGSWFSHLAICRAKASWLSRKSASTCCRVVTKRIVVPSSSLNGLKLSGWGRTLVS